MFDTVILFTLIIILIIQIGALVVVWAYENGKLPTIDGSPFGTTSPTDFNSIRNGIYITVGLNILAIGGIAFFKIKSS